MNAGAWTAACLVLVAVSGAPAAPPADAWFVNQTRFNIPINIQKERAQEIKALKLYLSTDEGKTWNQVGLATPQQSEFPITAQVQGMHWYSVVIVDQQNREEPPVAELSRQPPGQKVLVDTFKPDVRFTTERQGESVVVRWNIREEYPDLKTFQLEYRSGESGEWQPVQATPRLTGEATIRAAGEVTVRLHLADLASNVGQKEERVGGPAEVVTTSATAPASEGTNPTAVGTTPVGKPPVADSASSDNPNLQRVPGSKPEDLGPPVTVTPPPPGPEKSSVPPPS